MPGSSSSSPGSRSSTKKLPGTRSARLIAVLAVIVLLVDVAAFWVVPRLDIPPRFWGSPIETVEVDGRALRLVHVDYQNGLRGVDSLGGLDGALFVLPRTMSSGHGMGMDQVPMPLDVAFFDSAGRFVDRRTMALCEPNACPGYYPDGEWQFAIEAPAGALNWVDEGSILLRAAATATGR